MLQGDSQLVPATLFFFSFRYRTDQAAYVRFKLTQNNKIDFPQPQICRTERDRGREKRMKQRRAEGEAERSIDEG